jgi:hypothetical protein
MTRSDYLFVLFILTFISHSYCDSCLPSSICGQDTRCSQNGRCQYDLIKYYNKSIDKSNITQLQSIEKCYCNEGWYTNTGDPVDCCYQQKSQTVAFLLEFFFGFGLGLIYIGQIKLGFIKLICYSFFCCSCYTIACCFCCREVELQNKNNSQRVLNFLLIFSVSGYFMWQFVDVILFGLNFYLDGSGVPLQRWWN